MIKRIFLILLALIPFTVFAQKTTGDWKIYSRYVEVSNLEQSQDKIYYVSGSTLYSYDKVNNESYIYSSRNKLNENKVSNIYYNANNKYLAITYPTGNIDLLYDNGEVVNIPYVKDAVTTFVPTINDIAFDGDDIYIATKFGLLIYDAKNHKIKQIGMYGKEISLVTVVGENVVVDQNHNLYYQHKNSRFETFENFKKISSGWWIKKMQGIENDKMLFTATDKKIYTFNFNFEKNNYTRTDLDVTGSASVLVRGKDAFYYTSGGALYSISLDGVATNLSTLPTQLQSQIVSVWDNPIEVWACDKTGLGKYNIEGGNFTTMVEKTKPESVTVDYPAYITSDKKGKVYVSTYSESRYLGLKNQWSESFINTIDGNKIKDITPSGLETFDNYSASPIYYLPGNKLGASNQLVIDPEDDDTYYVSTYWDGVYKIKNGQMVSHYYTYANGKINSSFIAIYGCRIFALGFDKENNLWCANEVNANTNSPALHFLPAEARKKETTTVEDWTPIQLGSFVAGRDVRLLICEKSNMIFLCDGNWNSPVVAYDTKGTYSDTSDDEFYLWNTYVDQDGKVIVPDRISSLCEDKDGRVWIGTTNGILEITDPSKALDPKMTVNRLKINDGSYLLDGLHATTISVDKNNRKWIGTLTDGIYYVDENGENVLEHFNIDNSYLPANLVYSVYVHPITNSVFVGTELGLVEYNNNSAPAQENYDNVYAYPNPVNPDETGWITIKGLMDNSFVTVTDINGNVVYTTRSTGGIVLWDGCETNGNRVKSGVYNVYASQEENATLSTPVTKIVVVK